MENIVQRIAAELNVEGKQVIGAIALLDDGATVPFISRYRKELTGGLDDSQLRVLEDRLQYLRVLEDRRQVILNSIHEQGKLTEELKIKIIEAESKTRLEDLYLPYKPKRRTKGQIAREAGLEPLAEALYNDHDLIPEQEALKYINHEHKITNEKEALDGACHILMERFSENAELLTRLRDELWRDGIVSSRMVTKENMEDEKSEKFRDYFKFEESLQTLPSHRALAIFRGRSEGVLRCSIKLNSEINDEGAETNISGKFGVCEQMIADSFNISNQGKPSDAWLDKVVSWTWKVKLQSQIETELLGIVRERAEEEAIVVFSKNLKDLLMAAPAGQRTTLGLDPGFRSGVKVCVVDNTGKLLDYTTIFPHPPQKKWKDALGTLATLCLKHKVELISIGNGTASRETTKLAGELIHSYPRLGLVKVVVSEAGASVYSASELAAREFPDVDVLVRGSVSIARRLQDPLAELVKIDPKSIGVGQYQHDVNQVRLMRALDGVVEDCVNAVGVDVNSASSTLLARVSGLNQRISENIVAYRDKNGQFDCRHSLKKIDSFGEKTFEQSAGFLRISNGSNPLDGSSVHPEAYTLVELIAQHYQCDLESLIGNKEFAKTFNPEQFTNEKFGVLTIRDIVSELEKPGRDPRPQFTAVAFKEGVETIQDLKYNMILEGVVTNVTNFGAFVDVGVHQDGLVHISSLSEKFVKDPREMVKVGEVVKVKVLAVEVDRKRISLTMRLSDVRDSIDNDENKSTNKLERKKHSKHENEKALVKKKKEQTRQTKGKVVVSSLASAFARAKELRK